METQWRQNYNPTGARRKWVTNKLNHCCLSRSGWSFRPTCTHNSLGWQQSDYTQPQTQWGRKTEPLIKPRSSKRSWTENILSNHQQSGQGCATYCLDSQTCNKFYFSINKCPVFLIQYRLQNSAFLRWKNWEWTNSSRFLWSGAPLPKLGQCRPAWRVSCGRVTSPGNVSLNDNSVTWAFRGQKVGGFIVRFWSG